MTIASVQCSTIARFVGKDLKGNDISVTHPASMARIDPNCVAFAKSLDEAFLCRANQTREMLVIACPEYEGKLTCSYIISENPRLDFVRVVREFFAKSGSGIGIHPTAVIEDGARIGEGVTIGANCYIEASVVIGAGTEIHHNVVILGDVEIGRNCTIKSGAVIGEEGFGFERDEDGRPIHFLHLGRIVMEDGVFIGSNSTIERATIDETRIGANAKIDDHVQIGHNCVVGANTIITAGTILCGGVIIGEACWIAPNVSIRQRLTVGDGAYVGLGSVVIRDVRAGTVVAGVPAKELKRGGV